MEQQASVLALGVTTLVAVVAAAALADYLQCRGQRMIFCA